jgi:replicative DNA helicase
LEDTVVPLIQAIHDSRLLKKISLAAYEVNEKKKPREQLDELLQIYNKGPLEIEEESDPFVTDDLQALLNEAVNEPGLNWRLDCLNRTLGPLRKGDFGFVFARPEAGKTTFLCSEGSNMLRQTDKNVLWFNNEEAGNKVKIRFIQAYFGVTLEQLYGDIQHYNRLFKEQTGGRFKLYDSAAIDRRTVEKLSETYLPGLIVVDQIDKIQGFEADREDLILGRIYQWFREISKRYCPVIGATQADGSGEGVRWLTMANVANAKTSKQAEADFILGIGSIPDSGYEHVRFLNISKNKLIGQLGVTGNDVHNRHGRLECLIEPSVARYSDIG